MSKVFRKINTSSSAITERPLFRVGYLWPKVEVQLGDNMYGHYRSIFNHCDVTGEQSS